MKTRRPCVVGESATSLIEVLVTMSIMGIAFASILLGLGTSTNTSDIHRKQATAETVLRSFSEAVKQDPYAECATTASYTGGGYSPPANFSVSIKLVAYWVPSPTPASPATPAVKTGVFATPGGLACVPPDTGYQRLNVEARSSDSKAVETLQVLKRRP